MTDTPNADHAPTDEALAEWVKNTCLMFGATLATAYQVAGLFVAALHQPEQSNGSVAVSDG
jgi:hypothetical protein